MSKHTPEPWTIRGNDATGSIVIDGSAGKKKRCVALAVRLAIVDCEIMANAHLILAAPALLAAIEKLLPLLMRTADADRAADAVIECRAAIAKAKSGY